MNNTSGTQLKLKLDLLDQTELPRDITLDELLYILNKPSNIRDKKLVGFHLLHRIISTKSLN